MDGWMDLKKIIINQAFHAISYFDWLMNSDALWESQRPDGKRHYQACLIGLHNAETSRFMFQRECQESNCIVIYWPSYETLGLVRGGLNHMPGVIPYMWKIPCVVRPSPSSLSTHCSIRHYLGGDLDDPKHNHIPHVIK